MRREHERGPEADQEHRGLGVRVRDRKGEPARVEVVGLVRAEAEHDSGSDGQDRGRSRDRGQGEQPLRGTPERHERNEQRDRVEDRQEGLVAGQVRNGGPDNRKRLPPRKGDEHSDHGELPPAWPESRPADERGREDQGREERIWKPVRRRRAACGEPGQPPGNRREHDGLQNTCRVSSIENHRVRT